MAKKQAAETETKTTQGPPTPKGKADAKPEAKGPKAEKKPRPPKADKGDKASPAPPAGETAPAGGPPSTPKATPAPATPGEKQKKKKPGIPPGRGKKLRNQLKNFRQRLAKEGPAPLP